MKYSLMKLTAILALAGLIAMGCNDITESDYDNDANNDLTTSEMHQELVPFAVPANADIFWLQDFSEDTDGWFDASNGWVGEITHIPGSETANVKGQASECPSYVVDRGIDDCYVGVFSVFDGYRDIEWPGEYFADIDVYLDPSADDFLDGRWGFDYIVASSNNAGGHLRDFNFHVGFVDGELLINGSNNADFYTNEFKLLNENSGNNYTVTEAGWYTLQHAFYNDGGNLAVDLNLFDENGALIWTATRNTTDDIATTVGGNRYAWFSHIDAANGIEVDNHSLYQVADAPETKMDCKKGGWEAFGFRNQGQCIRFVNTGKDSR